ncbi:MAG TPA: hypothetical protein VL854_03020 [Nitrososphaeraceae archaeon]|nr:hypothetical protein [Nitrososphaeraceae archaeon]
MTARDQQIVTCYEDLNMSLEDISVDSGFDIEAIKSCLIQYSQRYRYNINKEELAETDITDDEFKNIRRVLKSIAITSEDDHLRARVGMFLWDKKRGEGKGGSLKPINVSINLINQQLKEMKHAKETKTIETSSENKLLTEPRGTIAERTK